MKNLVLYHVIRMTKLFTYAFLIQCLSMSFLFAWNGNAQVKDIEEVMISLTLEGAKIEKAFSSIEKMTGFVFVYTDKELKGIPRITTGKETQSVYELLSVIGRQSGLYFKQVNQNIHVRRTAQQVLQEEQVSGKKGIMEITITGKVTDENGEPIPGATISVPGTNIGTATDIDGNYSLTVPDNSRLVFSFIGYESQTVEVGNRDVINITLRESSQALDEVVVVGYGTMRKSELTSAIARVDGEDLKIRPVARLDQALQGQMAGVHVQQNGGKPGKPANIRVRGIGSLTAGNDPLFVVDGFPVDAEYFANISLDNVESVEVLKDAASAAIYGSRGSGGVILVTTKRGKKGQGAKFDFHAFTGLSNMERNIEFLPGHEYMQYIKELRDDAFQRTGGNLSIPPMQRPFNFTYDPNWVDNPELVPDYKADHWDAILRSPGALNQKYSMSVSGSSDKSRYLISGEYFGQEGIVKSNDIKRYSFNTNVETDITNFLTVGVNLSSFYLVDNDPNTEGRGSVIHRVLESTPLLPPRQGYWGESLPFNEWRINNHPIGEGAIPMIEHMQNESIRSQTLVNAFAQVNIMPGLTFRSSLGANFFSNRRDMFQNQIIARTGMPSGESWSNQTLNVLNENILNYNKTFADKHSIGGVLGFTSQQQTSKSTYLRGTNFPNDLVPTLNAATQWVGNTNENEWSLLSYLSRINYSYDGKYMVSASIRADGSSRFGANNRWGNFPSLSGGWQLDRENFMQSVNFISQLKLRGSWGKTGNNNIGDYNAIATLGSFQYVFGLNEVPQAGLAPNRIANPNLGWELKETTDIGVDLGFFEDRLSLTVDYYIDLTSDLLLNVPVPSITGFTTELQNIGAVRNRGWDFELRTRNTVGKFGWTTNANLSLVKNEVKRLGPEGAPIIAGDWWGQVNMTAIGHPIGSFFLLKQIGVYNTQEEINATPHWGGTRPGDVIIEDYNGDGVIDANDRQILASPIPTYFFGITNSFQYNGFDMSIFVNGSGGNHIFQDMGREFDSAGDWKNPFIHWENRWRSPEQPGDGRTPRANGTGATRQLTDRRLWRGDYVRLRNITLGYTLPQPMIEKLRLTNLRVYLQGENLFTWDHYPVGFTPEVDFSGGSALTAGRDYVTYPNIRTFLIGINVSF